MAKNDTIEISVDEDKCTGCLICQLICSYYHLRKFAPNKANIQIIPYELTPKISFLDECKKCGQCVQHCIYGALELKEAE